MKAILFHNYGPPEDLRCEEVAIPTPRDNEVLLKVCAASVNPYDWHCMRGTPYFIRIMLGVRKPKETRLGLDVAGRVEAVGKNVTQFQPGDEVFGSCPGAFAEYACAPESSVQIKPANVTFDQAAAVAVAALTALQAFRAGGQLQPGQKLLVNGAAGGVGTFAIQIAKSCGADVTAVCSAGNLDLVRSIGADRAIDYTKENFTTGPLRYDFILDAIGNHSLLACRRILNPHGAYVSVGAPAGRWMIGGILRGFASTALSRLGSQKLAMIMTKSSKEDLIILRDLLQSGKLTPVIDRRYNLTEVPQAIRYLEQGHARGKVLVTLQ
jgi:NADPH:quinone reductase-like Zn-dependent oxidoreductase